MSAQPPLYDLLLLLSQAAPEEQRAKVLSDVEAAIRKAGGELERNDDWGRRPTTYQIRHQSEAEYHLIQFRSPPELIEELSHNLHITDGVLRFRVIKNRPGTPPAPSSPPPVLASAGVPVGGPSRSESTRPSTERPSSSVAAAESDGDEPATEEP